MRYDLPKVAAKEPAETVKLLKLTVTLKRYIYMKKWTVKLLKLTVTAECYIYMNKYKECKQYYGSFPPVLKNINSPVLWTSGNINLQRFDAAYLDFQ
jgi:hypothetical protein